MGDEPRRRLWCGRHRRHSGPPACHRPGGRRRPGAATLGFIASLLAICQIGGPLLILIWGGAAWWLFGQDHQAWGVFVIVWGLFVGTIDNFIKPWLIGFGVEMPMSLTILGVFGGFLAFGFLGLFIGPTLIAIMFTLLQAWE